MNILDIISKKENKNKLNKEEINYFVNEYTTGNITDSEAANLIRAIYTNGMDVEEITDLTLAMANSGEVLDLSELGNVVDKHSTGGIGDKITLILMPIVASLGIKVAKMSGRGLGLTGGTKDKLESIPGYKTEINIEEFIDNVKKIGISLIGQTLNLAPADKKIYALRDEIHCVDSIPLIASSIMSKKIAAGANKIVMDVTCGSGAFMKNEEDAKKLANTMINIGKLANKETICVITNMDEPVGRMVGNTLEIIETRDSLNGNIEEDVKQIVLELGAYMLKLAGKGKDIKQNKKIILEEIENKNAYNKFIELIENQGGNREYIESLDKKSISKYKIEVRANKTGYINSLNAEEIGKAAFLLGAGRVKKEDDIDYNVGIELNKKIGDYVENNELLAIVYANDMKKGNEAKELVKSTYIVKDIKPESIKEIIGIVE